MHSPVPVVYNDITTEHFSNIEKAAQGMGLSVVANSGQTKKDGVEVSWIYDPDAQALTITLLQSPFYLPVGLLEDHFNKLVSETKPEPVVETETKTTA